MNVENTGYQKYRNLTYELCREVTKKYSTSFYSATQLFPPAIREAIHSIYGFVRLADEIVDSFHGFDQKVLLERFEQDFYFAVEQGVSTNPVIHAFLITVKKYEIDDAYIRAFLSSMRADLEKKVYSTKLEADAYIYGSADVVGLMCLRVFCNNDPQLFQQLITPAMRLGSAFQKVNFLRDLKEDVLQLGRIYFPCFSLEHFDEKTKQGLVKDIEADFAEARKGITLLPSDSRLAVQTAYLYYLRLLEIIKVTPAGELVKRRIRVANSEKFRLLTGALIRHKLHIASK